jgi:hypothetical protein
MADGIIYLDVDDEITSAAARIRSVDGLRAVVVLPYGSRVATSRINFRLLARDAVAHQKRLSIVAGDAATRALAASAGLPVFGTVGEYEEAVAAESDERAAVAAAEEAETAVTDTDAAAAADASDAETIDPADAAAAALVGGAAVAGVAHGADAGPQNTPETESTVRQAETSATTMSGPTGEIAADRPPPAGPGRTTSSLAPTPTTVPVVPGAPRTGDEIGWRRVGRTPILIGVAVIVLATVVGGVAAFLLLPTATATVTPAEEQIGPVSLSISARPDVTAPDAQAGEVPAELVTTEVQAQGTYTATGRRVEEEPATGSVRFDNLDPTRSNTIAKGAVVSTASGVRFKTDARVTVPAAKLVGLQIVPARASVDVTAVEPGLDGNVESNTILTVPRGEEPFFLKVTNPDPTSGGTREEFARVTQDDVDAATADLAGQLEAAFVDKLDDPDLAPGDVTVFAETAMLGPAEMTAEPDSLVGQEVATFDLGAQATGTVITVDSAPVRSIAEARLESLVEPGYAFVEGSSEITESDAVVTGQSISYPVVATARQVAILDPDELERRILGRSLDEADAILGAYGDVVIVVWPDWVAAIPTLDSRVEVLIDAPQTSAGPSPSPGPSSTPGGSGAPAGSGTPGPSGTSP